MNRTGKQSSNQSIVQTISRLFGISINQSRKWPIGHYYESANRPPDEKTSLDKNRRSAKRKWPSGQSGPASRRQPIGHHTRKPCSIRNCRSAKTKLAKRSIWISQSASTSRPIGHQTGKTRPLASKFYDRQKR